MSKITDLQACIENAPSRDKGRYDFWFQAEVKECMKKRGYVYIGTGKRNDDADDEQSWEENEKKQD